MAAMTIETARDIKIAQATSIEQLNEILALTEETNEASNLRLAAQQRINQLQQQSAESAKRAIEDEFKRLEVIKKINIALQDTAAAYDSQQETLRYFGELRQKELKAQGELEEALKEQQIIELKIQETKANIAENDKDKNAKKELVHLEAQLELQKKVVQQKRLNRDIEKENNEAGEQMFTNSLNALGVKSEKQKLSFAENMANVNVSSKMFAQSAADFLTSGVALRNVWVSVAAKVVEMTMVMANSLDKVRSDIYKATGGMTELGDEAMWGTEWAGEFAVSAEAMGQSYLSLSKNSSNFSELTAKQQRSIAGNTAQLQSLGVSADVASKNFSIFTQSLGMTTSQANASARELVSLAHNLHMSVEEVTDGFGKAASTVAAYGKNAVGEFAKLAAESKALGLSVQELINIVKGADTFQGAAEQAGKLNAMLGGGLLNSSQLLVASESERIELIRDAVMQTGRSFESMSKYEQIALANAAGIQDLTVAQKLFNQQMDGDELDRYLGKTNALGMSEEQMEEQAAAARDTTENLKIIMEQFAAVIGPVVKSVAALVGLLSRMGIVGKIVASIIGTIVFFNVLYAGITGVLAIKKALAATATAANTANLLLNSLAVKEGIVVKQAEKLITTEAIAVKAADTAAETASTRAKVAGTTSIWARISALVASTAPTWAAAVANWALASAVNFTIAGFVILAAVILAVIGILHLAGSPMFYAIFGFIALGVLALGFALKTTKQEMYAFGAAMLMAGAGAFMAFHGLEGFAKALSALDTTQLAALVITIGLLAIAMILLFGIVIYAGAAAVVPMLALGAAFLLMGAGAMMLGYGLSMVNDSLVGLAANMAPLMILPIFLQLMAFGLIAVSVGLAIFTYTLISVGFAMMAAYTPILTVIAAISALSIAISSITPEKSIALKTTVDSIRNFVDTGKNVTPETISNLDEVVKQIHKLNVEATISKAVNVIAPFKELIDAVNGQTKANAESDKTVVMKLDDRVFGSAVIKTLNTYGTANTAIRRATPAGSGS